MSKGPTAGEKKKDVPLPQVHPSIPTHAAAPYWTPLRAPAGACVRGIVKVPVALVILTSTATAPAQLELYSVAVAFTSVELAVAIVPFSPA